MAEQDDPWAARIRAVTVPAMVLSINIAWAVATAKVLLRLLERRKDRRAEIRLPALHHVQIAMPPGREDEARAFYGDLLGLRELAKPANLAVRGGCWFALGEHELHLGVEQDFRPARKAHTAIQVVDSEQLKARLTAAGVATREDEPLSGYSRFYAEDPFGNRLEFLTLQHGL